MYIGQLTEFRERCKEKGCRAPVYRVSRCRFHFEQFDAARDEAKAAREAQRAARKAQLPPTSEWQRDECYVYAVRAANGLVKIGSSIDPRRRLLDLQGQSPVHVDLTLLGYVRGSLALERKVHRFLAAYRSHGEWFRDDGPVRSVVAAIESNDLVKLKDIMLEKVLASVTDDS